MKLKTICLLATSCLFTLFVKAQENSLEYSYYEFEKPKDEIVNTKVITKNKDTTVILKMIFKIESDKIIMGASYYNFTQESTMEKIEQSEMPNKPVFIEYYKQLLKKLKTGTNNKIDFYSLGNFHAKDSVWFGIFYTQAVELLNKHTNLKEESNLGLSLENFSLLREYENYLETIRMSYYDKLAKERATKTKFLQSSRKKLRKSPDGKKHITEVKKYRKLIRKINEEKATSVFLTGNALLNSSAEKDDKADATSGVGIKVRKIDQYEFNATITVTQSNDTINTDLQRDYGRSILTPGIRKYSFQSCFRQHSIFPVNRLKFMRKIGAGVDFNCTRYNWSFNNGAITKTVVPFAMDAILPYTWINLSKPGKDIKISSEFGYAVRIVGGDLNDEERTTILGLPKVCYSGLQAGFNMRYNGLRIFYYILFFENKRRVEGLTHGQALAGISFTGTIDQIGGNNSKKVLREIYK